MSEIPVAASSPPRAQRLLNALRDGVFPVAGNFEKLAALLQAGADALPTFDRTSSTFYPTGETEPVASARAEAFGVLAGDPRFDTARLVHDLVRRFFPGAVNWRSPDLCHNVGTTPTTAALAMDALAADANIYLINDGLAGNCVHAEADVGAILTSLAALPAGSGRGLFTFGGTGTNLYAMKVGIRKALPESGRRGIAGDMRVLVTEGAHFSHAVAADWLGLGTDRLLVAPADAEGRSVAADAESQLVHAIAQGARVAALIVNGGTTYDHAVDDIPGFVALRDRLVREYQLPYQPHVHVDTVIGWAWLMFRDYDFAGNPLDIAGEALEVIRQQYERVRSVGCADSWGVDFHKGVGFCPVDCSMIVMNDSADFARLSKKHNATTDMHQLAQELSALSPVDYTLETSRRGAKALAALASLHALGRNGYRVLLANLVETTLRFRQLCRHDDSVLLTNPKSLGFVTMLCLYPPEARADERRGRERCGPEPAMRSFVARLNEYNAAFVAWDHATRMIANRSGFTYSFSSSYTGTASGARLSAIKVYPVSPWTAPHLAASWMDTLMSRKRRFDQEVWFKPDAAASRAGV